MVYSNNTYARFFISNLTPAGPSKLLNFWVISGLKVAYGCLAIQGLKGVETIYTLMRFTI